MNGYVWLAMSTGSGFATPQRWLEANAAGGQSTASYEGRNTWLVDANSDGRSDYLWIVGYTGAGGETIQELWVATATQSAYIIYPK